MMKQIKKFLIPSDYTTWDSVEKFRWSSLIFTIITLEITALAVTFAMLITEDPLIIRPFGLAVVCLITLVHARRRRNIRFPALLFFAAFLLVAIQGCLNEGGLTSPPMNILVAIPIISMVLVSRKAGIIFTLINILVILTLSIGHYTEAFGLSPLDSKLIVRHSFSFVLLNLTLVGLFFIQEKLQRSTNDKWKRERGNYLHAAKVASLGEMAAGIAHEINNPLAIATMSLKHIEPTTENCRKHLKTIESSLQRISNITNSVVKIGYKTDTNDKVCDINEALEDIKNLVMQRAKNNDIKLNIDELQSQITASCSTTAFSQIILNLLNNAIDAVSDQSIKEIDVEIAIIQKNLLSIIVRDSGAGISKTLENDIFIPFFTTKEVGKGTGLGLSLSRSLAEEHGGKLNLRSAKPTEFELILNIVRTKNTKC